MKLLITLLLVLITSVVHAQTFEPCRAFLRGDSDYSGTLELTDGIYILNWLHQGGPAPPVADAADGNDDGQINDSDAMFIIDALFNGGPPLPYPTEADGENLDPSYDQLDPDCTFAVPFFDEYRTQSADTAGVGTPVAYPPCPSWDDYSLKSSGPGSYGGYKAHVEFENNDGFIYGCHPQGTNANSIDIEFFFDDGQALNWRKLGAVKSDGTAYVKIYWAAHLHLWTTAEWCHTCATIPAGTDEVDYQSIIWAWHGLPNSPIPAQCQLNFVEEYGADVLTFNFFPIGDMWNRPAHTNRDDYVPDASVCRTYYAEKPLEECLFTSAQYSNCVMDGPRIYAQTTGTYLAYRMWQLGVPATKYFSLDSIEWKSLVCYTEHVPMAYWEDLWPHPADGNWIYNEVANCTFEQLDFSYAFGKQDPPDVYPDPGAQVGFQDGPWFDWDGGSF